MWFIDWHCALADVLETVKKYRSIFMPKHLINAYTMSGKKVFV